MALQYQELSKIKSPQDVKLLNKRQRLQLCDEIRDLLIERVSTNGGHLASNLGVVELTVALHTIFDCPTDQIIWDVGHQSYAHKLLTGRYPVFDTLRKEGGISGFPKPSESIYDAFIAGHAGTSISVASGLATAKMLKHEAGHVISVTGDGAMSNGMIYEAINNVGRSNEKLIVILNDNEMSISKNVGAFAKYLSIIRTSDRYFQAKDFVSDTLLKIPVVGTQLKNSVSKAKSALRRYVYHSNFFEDFGFRYFGPVNGHDLEALCDVLARAKEQTHPVLVHVETKKGIGYAFAQNNPMQYHGVSGFDREKGIAVNKPQNNFSAIFGEEMVKMAQQNKTICAVTAAMGDGTGLSEFSNRFKRQGRFFDVGIAEEHALTFCAGLSKNGMLPVFAVYSTFLQRCYDQLIHDVAIEPQHIVLAVDRAGIVGEDGETHQGVFDVAMMRTVPYMTIYSPSNYADLRSCLQSAFAKGTTPVAVRYPRGKEPNLPQKYQATNEICDFFEDGTDNILLITYGRLWEHAIRAKETLSSHGIEISLLKLTKITPISTSIITHALKYKKIFFYEEGILHGGIGEFFGSLLLQQGYQGKYSCQGIEGFVPQASVEATLQHLQLDYSAMTKEIIRTTKIDHN